MAKYYQGRFRPKHPKKYKGNPTEIIFRSLWELQWMRFLDETPDILEWSSESIIIGYRSPIDQKPHRYFPDFFIKKKTRDNKIVKQIVEIKPLNQVFQPERKKKKMQTYINEIMEYGKNMAKWRAASEYCKKRGMEFIVVSKDNKDQFMMLTEKEIGI